MQQQQTPPQIHIPVEPEQGNMYHFAKNAPASTSYQPPIAVTTINDPLEGQKIVPKSTEKSETVGLFTCVCFTGTVLCCIVLLLVFAVFSLIITITEIVISTKYYNQCPAEPNIPRFLYVAGILGLVLAILRIVTRDVAHGIPVEEQKSEIFRKASFILRAVSVVAIFALVLYLIYIMFITFGIYYTVQYDRQEKAKTYCHKTLYRFTMFIGILHIITGLFLCYGESVELKKQQVTETKKAETNT